MAKRVSKRLHRRWPTTPAARPPARRSRAPRAPPERTPWWPTSPAARITPAASSSRVTFTIAKATPTVTVSDAGGTYNGSHLPGHGPGERRRRLETVSPTLTYYAGSRPPARRLQRPPARLERTPSWPTSPAAPDYSSASSSTVTFTIAKAHADGHRQRCRRHVQRQSTFPATALVNGGATLESVSTDADLLRRQHGHRHALSARPERGWNVHRGGQLRRQRGLRRAASSNVDVHDRQGHADRHRQRCRRHVQRQSPSRPRHW